MVERQKSGAALKTRFWQNKIKKMPSTLTDVVFQNKIKLARLK
jgi:hypothetical protein